MHEYETAILKLLKKQKSATLEHIQKSLAVNSDSIIWALENLGNSGMLEIERDSRKSAKLTSEGQKYLKRFPEEELVSELHESGDKPASGIRNNIGLVWAKRNGWIAIEEGKVTLTKKGLEVASENEPYAQRKVLAELASADPSELDGIVRENTEVINSLRNRNLVDITDKGIIKSVDITDKGSRIDTSKYGEGIGALTREIIVGGHWKTEKFRPYDINASSENIYPAREHPMHEFIDVIRNTWLGMGFTEVSGPIIESAFWNFDALFVPPDHPTRDMQDTFFLKNPSKLDIDDIALMGNVKRMHVKNWKETWKESLEQQALLRTHTTSVSARHIKQFANNTSTYPIKLFSVGKVFRNESIDYKHLAELHQVDGIIIGNNLTLSNLIYTLKQFYSQLGMDNITIKPSYFPFVEPGLEIDYYDEKKKDTIELCGGGIIRKEIVKAMGGSKTVLAWGGGLERLMFKALGINSLTDLYKNDVGWLRERKELEL